MPATDQYWRKLPTMHLWFAGSAIAMAVATWLMMAKDQSVEWRGYQRQAEDLRAEKLRTQLEAYRDAEFEARQEQIDQQIKSAEEQLTANKEKVQGLEAELRELSGQLALALTEAKFKSAERDVKRADFDLAIRDAADDKARQTLVDFSVQQSLADQYSVRVQELKAQVETKQSELTELKRPLDEAQAAKKLLEAEQVRMQEQLALLNPNDPDLPDDVRSLYRAVKREVKEWPILDAFNPHLRIQYDWPSLQGAHPQIRLGMATVDRVDRCRSCHININDFNGDQPNFPAGTEKDGGYKQPFSAHPNPDLFLTSTSPHPIEEFGCTICHGGDGSGTSFQNASHTPDDPAQAEQWHEEHGWFHNHFWEQPMYPASLTETGCIRCHHQVTELGVNAEFGPTAPKVFEGYELIKEYGCFGCHPINGYDGTKPIGPDLRLEPQTLAEAMSIAADPNQVAGEMRKVGPSLRHVASKVAKGFIAYWTEEPKRFRPDTRMPQFFHLSNQDDPTIHRHDVLAELLQPIELAGIAAYLESKSQPLELMTPREGYQPDAARGKVLLAQRGCLACHTHNDEYFAGIKQTFGPNLTRTHEKIRPGQEGFNWLYTWLRDPTRYHPRTKMPDTFLLPEETKDAYIDPAADIAAFLLAGGPKEFPATPLPGVYLGVSVEPNEGGEGVRVTEVLPDSPAERAKIVQAQADDVPSLLAGDVILSLNGKPVKSSDELNGIVSAMTNGAPVSLVVVRGNRQAEWSTAISTPLDDLVRLYLGKSLSAARVNKVFEDRKFPVTAAAWQPRPDGSIPLLTEFLKGDEVELAPQAKDEQVSPEDWEFRKLQYIGRRTISRYGCYGCHDIANFEEGRPIGTALQDWGRKDTSQLAVEHIEEYLHHHGEPDGTSTAEKVHDIIERQYNDGTASHDERMQAFFYESLLHHGRPGFLWQKLRDPRSYDFKKTETKGWDERLRMPEFPFSEPQIESVATFVLGLVADPPAEPYIYSPKGPPAAIVQGEKVLDKYNCAGCHILELPGVNWSVNIRDFVGLTRPEIVDFFVRHSNAIAGGALTQDMLASRTPLPEGALPPKDVEALPHLVEFLINCETLLEGQLAEGTILTQDVAPLLARLAKSRDAEKLQEWLDAHPETLIADNIAEADYPDAIRLYMQLKPPVQHGPPIAKSDQRQTIKFHGLMYSSDPDFGEDTYDLWENLDVGGRYKLSGLNSRFIVNPDNPVVGKDEGRGGTFMKWLYNKLALEKAGGEPSLMVQHLYMSQQASPPPLYKEGIKVQTPWLFNFLKNPEQLRFTTVLRMPRFNMDDEEAQALADYFAAVDDVPYPYQHVEQRTPEYLTAMQLMHGQTFSESSDDYLTSAWKVINGNQCIKCHSIGGRKYQGGGVLGPDGQPVDIRGPDLKRVQNRLRPDWTQVWVFNPKWFVPYTSMPANLPRNQQNFPDLYGGQGRWQNAALVDALMNYSELLERLGVTIYNPPGTPAAPDGANPAAPATPPPATN